MKKILFFALAAMICVGASARGKKKASAPKLLVPTVQAVPADSFSYAIGVAQAPSLKQYIAQQEGVSEASLTHFVEALTANYTQEQQDMILAQAAGIKIARMNSERIIPSISKQFGGEDSTYMRESIFVDALAAAVLGQAHMADSVAQALVERQQEYRKDVMRCEGLNWLTENAKKPGIKTTESGLQYEVVTMGTGAVPTESDEVEVNYEGKLIDGTVFDSSYSRGKSASFGVTQVIKGWTEALKMMPVGSVWNLYIPYNLAYGETGSRSIPPYSTLVFKVELISIKDKAAK